MAVSISLHKPECARLTVRQSIKVVRGAPVAVSRRCLLFARKWEGIWRWIVAMLRKSLAVKGDTSVPIGDRGSSTFRVGTYEDYFARLTLARQSSSSQAPPPSSPQGEPVAQREVDTIDRSRPQNTSEFPSYHYNLETIPSQRLSMVCTAREFPELARNLEEHFRLQSDRIERFIIFPPSEARAHVILQAKRGRYVPVEPQTIKDKDNKDLARALNRERAKGIAGGQGEYAGFFKDPKKKKEHII
jgi:hypothetical protein